MELTYSHAPDAPWAVYVIENADCLGMLHCATQVPGNRELRRDEVDRLAARMKKGTELPPRHLLPSIIEGSGLPASEALVLRLKADLTCVILDALRHRNYTEAHARVVLDEDETIVRHLLSGDLAYLTLEMLIRYALRLDIRIGLEVEP